MMTHGCIHHDEVVEQIDRNSMLNVIESICSAPGLKLGKSWEAYVTELPKIAVDQYLPRFSGT